MKLKTRITLGLLRCVAMLPLWVLYRLSDLVAFILYRVAKYRRKVVRDNLTRCFPDASPSDIRRWERQFYRHLCDTFIEALKLLHISDREAARRIRVEGAEKVDAAVQRGRSVVLLLGHYANWEWVTAINSHFKPGAVGCQIYHPLSSKTMDEVMLRIRSRFKSENIPMKRTLRRLVEIERSGGKFVCGFISDQRPTGEVLRNWTDFMGIDTPYLAGGEEIGRKLGAEFLYVDMERTSRGHYTITFREINPEVLGVEATEENPYTVGYLRMLEAAIRRNPPYWLWSHNRFIRTR